MLLDQSSKTSFFVISFLFFFFLFASGVTVNFKLDEYDIYVILNLFLFCYFVHYKCISVFSIWKSLWVLQKACIKIVAHAIYIYLSFSYTLVFCSNIKSWFDYCFRQQLRPRTTIQYTFPEFIPRNLMSHENEAIHRKSVPDERKWGETLETYLKF